MIRRSLLLAIGFFMLPLVAHGAASVVIHEVQLAGQTSRDEFVELMNSTDAAIDLTGWRLTKKTASGNETNLVTTFSAMSIPAHGFLLIAHPTDYKGTAIPDLVYSTSATIADDNAVLLYSDAGDTLVDRVGMGKAADREGTAAGNPDPGQSIARSGGADTDDNGRDFVIATPSPTNRHGSAGSTLPPPGSSTTAPPPAEQSSAPQTSTPKISTSDIVVNEVYPNPPGSDEDEFIELKNNGSAAIDISRWEVGVSRGRHFMIGANTTIAPSGFLVLPRQTTGLALDNSGDVVALYLPEEDRPFFTVRYSSDAPEGMAYGRSDTGKRWQWTTARTPGAVNVLTDPPLPPVLSATITPASPRRGDPVIFDASDSFDPDRDLITFSWEFGDGEQGEGSRVSHVYGAPGTYPVRLTGTTPRESTVEEMTVVITGSLASETKVPPPLRAGPVVEGESAPKRFSEVEPPKGSSTSAYLQNKQEEVLAPISVSETESSGVSIPRGTTILRGSVLVPPGRFGKTRAMMMSNGRAVTAQYTGDWPDVPVGAVLELTGRVSPADDTRFLVKTVRVIESTGAYIAPRAIATTELTDIAVGSFVRVNGEITEKHGSTLFLDDGKGEAQIQVKTTTGISAASMQEGSRLEVSGVVLLQGTTKTIAPRGLEDIAMETDTHDAAPAPWMRERRLGWPWALGIGGGLVLVGLGMQQYRKHRRRSRAVTVPSELVDPNADEDG